MGSSAVAPDVIGYLNRHPNRVLTVDDLSNEAGLKANSVTRIMRTLLDRQIPGLEKVTTNTYILRQPPRVESVPQPKESTIVDKSGSENKTVPSLFEQVRVLRNGNMLLEDENGDLWTAQRVRS